MGRFVVSLVSTVAAVPLLAGCGGPSLPAPVGATATASTASKSTAPQVAAARTRAIVAGSKGSGGPALALADSNLVAQVKGPRISVYRTPGGSASSRLANPLPSGAPLVFLVLGRRGDWLHVLLPVRPNGSQGWLRASDVGLVGDDFRITVSTGRHELTVYRAGAAIIRVPVGIGTSGTPTPGGTFYIKELLRPPNPNGAYGPYAYGLSGHSDVLNQFLGGDGEIGIHGTDDPAGIGHDVSHGCIRMRNADITRLAHLLPLGTPVQIVS